MADMINQHIASSYSYKQYYNNEHSMVIIKPLDFFFFLQNSFAPDLTCGDVLNYNIS